MTETIPTTTSPKRRAKFLVGGGVLIATIVVMIGWAMSQPGAASFYVTTTELAGMSTQELSRHPQVRVNGKVVPGSIEHEGLATEFLISDGRTELLVRTERPVPDTLKDESDVVALGLPIPGTPGLQPFRFEASEVLAKCPSKFKAKAT